MSEQKKPSVKGFKAKKWGIKSTSPEYYRIRIICKKNNISYEEYFSKRDYYESTVPRIDPRVRNLSKDKEKLIEVRRTCAKYRISMSVYLDNPELYPTKSKINNFNGLQKINIKYYYRVRRILKRHKVTYEEFLKEPKKYPLRETKKSEFSTRKEYSKNQFLKRTYNITLEQYNKMVLAQDSKCAICGKEEIAKNKDGSIKPLAVDHCHITGKVRELLCSTCNNGLGCFKDNIDNLTKAINYLNKNQK